MSFRDTNYYGLNISKTLTDLQDTKTAVTNIGLNEQDLTKISGSAALGTTATDFQSISKLDQYLQRSLVAYTKEVATYREILDLSADPTNKLRGNLEVEGVLGGSALKYQYYDGTDQTIKIADISTSRTSSWSSPVAAPVSTSPIQYGLDVDLLTGVLQSPNLEIFKEVQDVIFPDSEIPTHKIKTILDGQEVYIFVMKNLPLIFEGDFRSLSAEVELFTSGFVSYRIFYVDDPLLTVSFENVGGETTTSLLVANDTLTRRKNIEIYHNPDNYRSISLINAGIKELPAATLDNLTKLTLDRNDLTNFPDINFFAPALSELSMSSNNFTLSDDLNLRTLNSNIIAKLPSTLTALDLGNCFNGPIEDDIFLSLSSLQSLNLASASSSLKLSGALPEVPGSIKIFNVALNIFSGSVPNSLLTATGLSEFIINNNEDLGNDQSIVSLPSYSSQNFTIFSIDITKHMIPDLSNRTLLTDFSCEGNQDYPNGNPIIFDFVTGAYFFENCIALERFSIKDSNVDGWLPPTFSGNNSLKEVYLNNTNLQGTYGTGYALNKDMFIDCLETLTIFEFSSLDLVHQEIHPETFVGCTALQRIMINGLNQFFTGNLPIISSALALDTIIISDTNISGNLWSSITNQGSLSFINVSNNNLTGPIPAYTNSSIKYLYLNNNSLTSFTGLDTPALNQLYIHFNQITGDFPDLSQLTNISILWANNNQFNGYVSGSLSNMSSLSRLELSVNNFGSSAINAIIHDLWLNYNNNPRPGVIINLASNGTPGATAQEEITYLQDRGWSIVTS